MPRKGAARVLGIVPYEGMKTAMEREAEIYPDICLDVQTGDLEAGADIVRSLSPGAYDCIISRGGTAQLIRQATNIPVVEIQLSVYDVLRAIRLPRATPTAAPWSAFPASPNRLIPSATCCATTWTF